MSNAIVKSVTNAASKVGFQLRKHSPELFLAGGIVCGIAGAVFACKATVKAQGVLEDTKEKVEVIHKATEEGKTTSGETYSEEDSKKDLAIVYAQTGVEMVKLYAPAIGFAALSIGSVLMSHNVLRKRNIALAAAYTAIDKGFKEYRGRVVDRFGEAVDRELRYNLKAKKISETVVDPETGKEKKEKTTVEVVDENSIDGYSVYARFFDDGCRGWEDDAEYNLTFLRTQESWANDKLRSVGHLFLNEVYDMLGIPRTKAGQVVGWVYDKDKDVDGDGYVSFGIYNIRRQVNRDFVNGYEKAILLDFNVDGVIWDLI